ncbi:MAG: peroxide stress protein YaaA, partial [Halioglobus sp.]|nr:peroxide stress protein YaaA [Halioglobus sp.]
LASNEYFKTVQPGQLEADIVSPVFKDLKGGKYKVVSFYAKKARGAMARYIIDSELNDAAGLQKFRGEGYRYDRAQSTARELVFTRDAPP